MNASFSIALNSFFDSIAPTDFHRLNEENRQIETRVLKRTPPKTAWQLHEKDITLLARELPLYLFRFFFSRGLDQKRIDFVREHAYPVEHNQTRNDRGNNTTLYGRSVESYFLDTRHINNDDYDPQKIKTAIETLFTQNPSLSLHISDDVSKENLLVMRVFERKMTPCMKDDVAGIKPFTREQERSVDIAWTTAVVNYPKTLDDLPPGPGTSALGVHVESAKTSLDEKSLAHKKRLTEVKEEMLSVIDDVIAGRKDLRAFTYESSYEWAFWKRRSVTQLFASSSTLAISAAIFVLHKFIYQS
ncbi:MAG: hypothetical protein SNF33_02510 [Candidatus Algichlamydia australiensis]|nr:hypothetical protein [Chlamydiales bacterium]